VNRYCPILISRDEKLTSVSLNKISTSLATPEEPLVALQFAANAGFVTSEEDLVTLQLAENAEDAKQKRDSAIVEECCRAIVEECCRSANEANAPAVKGATATPKKSGITGKKKGKANQAETAERSCLFPDEAAPKALDISGNAVKGANKPMGIDITRSSDKPSNRFPGQPQGNPFPFPSASSRINEDDRGWFDAAVISGDAVKGADKQKPEVKRGKSKKNPNESLGSAFFLSEADVKGKGSACSGSGKGSDNPSKDRIAEAENQEFDKQLVRFTHNYNEEESGDYFVAGITNAFISKYTFNLSYVWEVIIAMDTKCHFSGCTIDNEKPDWVWLANEWQCTVREAMSIMKMNKPKRGGDDLDAPEESSSDSDSDQSVSDNEESETTVFTTFSAFIDFYGKKYEGQRNIELLPGSILLPESLKEAFSNDAASVAAGVSIDELAQFLHYVLSDFHLGSTSHSEACDPLFGDHGHGVRHVIRTFIDSLDLGEMPRKILMGRFYSPLQKWYTENPEATLSTLYPQMILQVGDDGDDYSDADDKLIYNIRPIAPLPYESINQTNTLSSDWLMSASAEGDPQDFGADNPFFNYDDADDDITNTDYLALLGADASNGRKTKKRKTTAIKSTVKPPLALQQSQLPQSFGNVSKITRPGVSSPSAKSILHVDETANHEQVEKKLDVFFRHPHSPTGADVQEQVTSIVPVVGKPDEWFVKFTSCPDVHFYLLRGELYFIPFGFVRFLFSCYVNLFLSVVVTIGYYLLMLMDRIGYLRFHKPNVAKKKGAKETPDVPSDDEDDMLFPLLESCFSKDKRSLKNLSKQGPTFFRKKIAAPSNEKKAVPSNEKKAVPIDDLDGFLVDDGEEGEEDEEEQQVEDEKEQQVEDEKEQPHDEKEQPHDDSATKKRKRNNTREILNPDRSPAVLALINGVLKQYKIGLVVTAETHEDEIYSATEYLVYKECGPFADKSSKFYKDYLSRMEAKDKLEKSVSTAPPESMIPPTDESTVIAYVFLICPLLNFANVFILFIYLTFQA